MRIAHLLIGTLPVIAFQVAASAQGRATVVIECTHRDPGGGPNAEHEGIMCTPKISVNNGDTIQVKVLGSLWCPENGDSSGTVTADPLAGAPACGFADNTKSITEPATPNTDATVSMDGTANAASGTFRIRINYNDPDCGSSGPEDTYEVEVNCNNPRKVPALSKAGYILISIIVALAGVGLYRRKAEISQRAA